MKKILLISIALFTTLSMKAQVEKLIYEMDWAGVEYIEWNYFVGEAPNASYYKATDEGLAITNPAINDHIWEVRVINRSSEDHGLSLEEGHDYVVRLTLKVPSDGHIFMQLGNLVSSWYDGASVTASDDWQVIDIESTSYYDISGGAHVLLGFGEMVGTTILKKVQVYERTTQDTYLPFVELGKQWYVVSADASPNYVCHLERYEMYENVERDGKIYAHTLCIEDQLCEEREAGLFREENRRVYKYDETAGRDIMLYDFSLKEGDTFTYEQISGFPETCKVLKQGWLEDGPQIVSSTLTSADTQDIKTRKLRTWTIGRDNGLGEYHEIATWVECIGSLENMFCPFGTGYLDCLAYVERKDNETNYLQNEYLPFSFCNVYDVMGQIHGCNLPTGAEDNWESDGHHKLTYELEGNRLHVYGEAFTNCGPNHYAYFYERKTDDPLVNKIEFEIQEVEPLADCEALHATDFYVPGFDPNMNYIVVDNQGEEHSVINKAPQNEYRPMIEDGKVWKVGGRGTGNPVQFVEYYYFEGDTIINGKTCKQMMRYVYYGPNYPDLYLIDPLPELSYIGAWYEEDQKVYFCNAINNQFRLMYDFSLNTNDTLWINKDYPSYVVGPKQTGGLEGYKGVYRDVMWSGDGEPYYNTTWLEGVGGIYGPIINVYLGEEYHALFLMSCVVGDEVIYHNDEYEDGATPAGARKNRFDFTHTNKLKPKTRVRSEEEPSLYGAYNDKQLDINLGPLDDAYQVCITDGSGKAVYEKVINAGNIVALNIDISAYTKGHYTVTVENSQESFTGEFETLTNGIEKNVKIKELKNESIYNLQGQRLNSLQKGLNIVNGRKIYVKN